MIHQEGPCSPLTERSEASGGHAARKDEHGIHKFDALLAEFEQVADRWREEPRLVKRGERIPDAEVKTCATNVALIDWFACTFKPSTHEFYDVLASVFLVPQLNWRQRSSGWQGYERRVDLGAFGLLAYGGEKQLGTAHLELNGHGCARISDWNAVRVWCETYGARITRIDLAHDDFEGAVVNIEQAVQWLDDGLFNAGGREPETSTAGDWLRRSHGRTLYVGKRKNGKLCRVYEKGKQLGRLDSPWCRVEVEFRGKSRVIPYDVLSRPGDYLSGAYPCLAFLSKRQDKMRTLSACAEISYEHLVRCVRTQYGPALATMARVEGGDAFAVLNQVMRPGVPKRLANLPNPRGESRQDGAA